MWGVAVAVFPSAVIEGTREAARTRAAVLGADRVAIAPDPTVAEGRRFLEEDAEAVRRDLLEAGFDVKAVGGAEVVALLRPREDARDDVRRPAALIAASPEAPLARGLRLRAGRWLQDDDPPDACVVEADVAGWLGRPSIQPGDALDLPGRSEHLHVVGVTAPRRTELLRSNDLGFDVDHPLLIQDAWKRSDRVVWVPLRGKKLDWIFLRVGGTEVKEAAALAASTLGERGQVPVTLHPLVLPFVLGEEIDRFQAVQFALFLACLAMGAVVMANMGLLTALQRKHELAIRRVEGATRADIVLQMVSEGILLTVLGILLGWFFGMVLAALRVWIEPVTGFAWRIPWNEALLAAGVALFVGTLAAFLPAWRAGAQTPVEGLIDDA